MCLLFFRNTAKCLICIISLIFQNHNLKTPVLDSGLLPDNWGNYKGRKATNSTCDIREIFNVSQLESKDMQVILSALHLGKHYISD